ncbi:uncharacterized protein [Drosophila pseudoobscura]|uniref:Uncharacterized protein n=1 Tax=Drosophila pseudoobscura pseudoobscura TaxID=46245 RepID=A0A6I8UMA4_DROPS|nr:uncharacterized protein LOC4800554 [Drosophila pseudoobscura]XP_033232387.1 uncharacterized protein LOC4800554 [Drosophila pseudoobscura]
MNKMKKSRKSAKNSGPSDPTGQSNKANASGIGSNNAGNQNIAGTEPGEQSTSDGVPFILVDAMPLTYCPPTVADLDQIEAKRMAKVIAECDRLQDRLEDTTPPPELDMPSTMTEKDEEFFQEMQKLRIFPKETEEKDGKERPGISRQGTFHIDRSKPTLNDRRLGDEPSVSSTESMRIINHIGDQLMQLQLLKEQPLVEGNAYCFLVSIKPEGGASNCFVRQIGLPVSSLQPETESVVQSETESIVQPEEELLVQLENESAEQPEKKPESVSSTGRTDAYSSNAVPKLRDLLHTQMPVSKAESPPPGLTIEAASEAKTDTIAAPKTSTTPWRQLSKSRFGYLPKKI